MAVRTLVTINGKNHLLNQVCDPISLDDPLLPRIAEDLRDTYLSLAIERAPTGFRTGGIAANQLGYNARVIILPKWDGIYPCQRDIIVNPVLTYVSKETFDFWGGCGSIPKIWACVKYPHRIQINGFCPDGTNFISTYWGVESACTYHEINHLDGKTILETAFRTYPSYEEFSKSRRPKI